MVVDHLDIPGRAFTPDETDPPPVVDANAVLSATVALQNFQTIAGRYAQIFKTASRVDHQELLPRALLDGSRQPANGAAAENRGGTLVGKAPDHGLS